MSPPDQDVATVEHAFGNALAGVVQTDGLHGNAGLPLEVIGDLISQEVRVRLFLGGLLFVPDDHPDRLALSCARIAPAIAHDAPSTGFEEINTPIRSGTIQILAVADGSS